MEPVRATCGEVRLWPERSLVTSSQSRRQTSEWRHLDKVSCQPIARDYQPRVPASHAHPLQCGVWTQLAIIKCVSGNNEAVVTVPLPGAGGRNLSCCFN